MVAQTIPAGDHRAHLIEKALRRHLKDVDDREADEEQHAEKVPESRELPPPEEYGERVRDRVDTRREREPGQHDERREHEQHERVRRFLQRIVGAVRRRLSP